MGIIIGVCVIGVFGGLMFKKKSGSKELTQQSITPFQQTQMQPQYQKQQFPSQPQPFQQHQMQPTSQICPYCNAQVPGEFRFCNMCGKQIKN